MLTKSTINIQKSFLVLIVSIFSMLLISCVSNEKQPQLKKSTIDVSTWNFTTNPALIIQGESLFYWKQFPVDAQGNFDISLLKTADTITATTFLWTHVREEKRGYGTF